MRFLLFLLSVVLPMGQSSKPAPVVPTTAMSRAGWLVGCWISTAKNTPEVTRESWRRASDDLLVATVTSSRPGFAPEYTFVRVESDASGTLAMAVQPPGARPTRFASEPAPSATELAFVAADNPSPARVIYRKGKGDLMVAIRDPGANIPRTETPMKKTDCR